MERLLSIRKTGELLGGLNPNDVHRLGRDGKIKLVPQVARGRNTKPRKYAVASSVESYIKGLLREAEQPAAPAPTDAPEKPSRRPTGIAAELARAKRYARR